MSPRIRRWLWLVFLVGSLGVGLELALLEHTESKTQLLPFGLIFLALLAWGWSQARPGQVSRRGLMIAMAGLMIGGGVGVALHYNGNVEFELEMTPALRGWPLFLASIRGATPALAPGILVQLGALGLILTLAKPSGGSS